MKKRKRLRGRKAFTHRGQLVLFQGLPVETSGDMPEEKLQALERRYGCSIHRWRVPTTADLIGLLDESIEQIEHGEWEPSCELPYCEAQVLTGCRDCPSRDGVCTGFTRGSDLEHFRQMREVLIRHRLRGGDKL